MTRHGVPNLKAGATKRKKTTNLLRRVDARGTLCPVPTVRVALALETMAPGDRLDLLADDPTTRRDFLAWCEEFGHPVCEVTDRLAYFRIRLQKNPSFPKKGKAP